MATQPPTAMLSALSLGTSETPTPLQRPSSSVFSASTSNLTHPTTSNYNPSSTNRLPPVLKKYMNPDLIRPPNSGLKGGAGGSEAARGPLLKLAGLNVPSPARSKQSLGKGKPPVAGQSYLAQGLHGTAQTSVARRVSSTNNTQQAHSSTSSVVVSGRKIELGKYDGGLEAEDRGKEVVQGESAKILELESAPSG